MLIFLFGYDEENTPAATQIILDGAFLLKEYIYIDSILVTI